MAGVDAEEKILHALKNILPHHFLKSKFLYPTNGNLEKKFTPPSSLLQLRLVFMSATAFMLKHGLFYYPTPVLKDFLLPHLAQLIF